MTKIVNFGIIGAGYIVGEHIKGIFSVPEKARVLAIADIIAERAKAKAMECNASAWYTDYRDLLKREEIDAVSICVPHDLHAKMCIDTAKAGKHILIEKPFTITVKETDDVLNAVRKAGVKLMVAHNQLFFPAIRQAKKFIEEGCLGKLTMINAVSAWKLPLKEREDWGWRLDLKKAGGGTLIDTGMHRVYLARYFGGDVESVHAYTDTLYFKELVGMEGEDTASVLLKFKSGAIGLVQVCIACYNPGPEQEWVEIYGTEGSIVAITGYGLPHQMMYHGNELRMFSTKLPEGMDGQLHLWYPPENCYVEEVKHFIDCIIEDKKPIATAYDGKASVEIVRAAYESAKTGKTVALTFRE